MKAPNEGLKFYEKSWFIMLMLFTPLFPVGLFLLWSSKSTNKYVKLFFTIIYIYAIYFTISTQKVAFLG